MIHLRCGDDILDRLRRLGAGPAVKWCDPLCQGPTPYVRGVAAWREMRARFIAAAYGPTLRVTTASARRALAREDAALRSALDHDEIVLWFEADLFDQIILARLLAWFAERADFTGRLSLVCIGEHADVPRFIGLGQLDRDQLAALLPGRTPVTEAQLSLGARAWDAFRAPDPRRIEDLPAGDMEALPFLSEALRRHLAELPGTADRLSLTERMILDAIAGGAGSAAGVFRVVHAGEQRPFLGDAMLWHVLDGLADGTAPLFRIEAPPGWQRTAAGVEAARTQLTEVGAAVCSGEADRPMLGAPPRWVGGVRIDAECPWQWNRDTKRIETGAQVTAPFTPARRSCP